VLSPLPASPVKRGEPLKTIARREPLRRVEPVDVILDLNVSKVSGAQTEKTLM
jgi:hypothetical protein